MVVTNYQRIIAELETVISDTKTLMARFEATGFDEMMSDDYLALHELYTRMVEEQRRYIRRLRSDRLSWLMRLARVLPLGLAQWLEKRWAHYLVDIVERQLGYVARPRALA